MDWNPHAVVPRMSSAVVAHERGVEAARWVLERLEDGDLDRRLLLLEWVRLLLERAPLIEPLGLKDICLKGLRPGGGSRQQSHALPAKAIEGDRDLAINSPCDSTSGRRRWFGEPWPTCSPACSVD